MMLTLAAAAPEGCDGGEFLAALEADRAFAAETVEIHIVQDATRPVATVPAGVTLHTAEQKSSIFELWGIGVRNAAAPYVALLDVRCPPQKGWLAAVLARLDREPVALFGPVACGWPSTSANVVGYLVEYVQFHPPLPEGAPETPGVNLVTARAHAQHPGVLRDDGFVKTRLLAHFDAIGVAPQPVEDAVVDYRKAFSFGDYCAHRYRHGRCYAANRALETGPCLLPRALLGTPLLPLVRTARIYRAARRARSVAPLLRWLHWVIAAETAWSVGEFMGYLFGEGGARRCLR